MINVDENKMVWDYAYKIGKIQGIIKGYHSNVVRSIDALSRIDEICNEPLESEKKFERTRIREDVRQPGYCEIGMSSCGCGWRGSYPISGCPRCNHSFVS